MHYNPQLQHSPLPQANDGDGDGEGGAATPAFEAHINNTPGAAQLSMHTLQRTHSSKSSNKLPPNNAQHSPSGVGLVTPKSAPLDQPSDAARNEDAAQVCFPTFRTEATLTYLYASRFRPTTVPAVLHPGRMARHRRLSVEMSIILPWMRSPACLLRRTLRNQVQMGLTTRGNKRYRPPPECKQPGCQPLHRGSPTCPARRNHRVMHKAVIC